MAHIMKLEEKRSDVNIATAMLWDAFQNDADIPAHLALGHQLPDEIPVGTHGNVIRRPVAWR